MPKSSPVTAVIVGAGQRAMLYASYATAHPDELRIVAAVDPDRERLRVAAETFGLAADRCFKDVEDLTARPRLADAAINGTMDHLHVVTSLPLLAAGYDILLEKPFGTNLAEMTDLVEAVRDHSRRVMICHVLRYAPFYEAIRETVASGEIGEVLTIQATEHVGYAHMATAYVRGKWNRRDRSHSSMLMSKSCHDLDLIAWFKGDVAPVRVASFGSLMHFRPEKAPEGSGTRCLTDCSIEPDCPYSARKLYLDGSARWDFYAWSGLAANGPLSREAKTHSLKIDNPHGRCVWRCDNDVVDHQTVAIEFADGSTATLNLVGGAARASRSLHLVGSRGEIEGKFEESKFVIRRLTARPGEDYSEETVDVSARAETGGRHGGGDLRLVADFVRLVRGEETSPSCTRIEDSLSGHLIGFAADEAMEAGQAVALSDFAAGRSEP